MTELEDGMRFQFAGEAEIFEEITRFMAAERACCSFFRFDLNVSPQQGPIYLTLGGSPEIKTFIKTMMPIKEH